jgi:lipoyl(octanoyl) transferase
VKGELYFMAEERPSARIVCLSGDVPYTDGLALQRRAWSARVANAIPDTLYLLEHEAVITIGRTAGSAAHIVANDVDLESRRIEVVESDRGGDVTYHAPGQLVGYPILNLNAHGRDLHRAIRTIEQMLIDVLSLDGLDAEVVPGLTGVWVGTAKIAAIGIKVSRWVCMHGFSLNRDLDLKPMREDIVPCGIHDRDVTSLAELGISTTRFELEERVSLAFQDRFFLNATQVASTLSDEMARLDSFAAAQ